MTIKEAQELIETWTAKNNVRNNELTNMALLTEEIGKLTRVMVRRFNDHANEPNFRTRFRTRSAISCGRW